MPVISDAATGPSDLIPMLLSDMVRPSFELRLLCPRHSRLRADHIAQVKCSRRSASLSNPGELGGMLKPALDLAFLCSLLGARPLCVGEREAQAAAAPARRLRGARRPFFSQLRPAGRLQTDSSPGPASAGCGRCTPGSIRRARSRCRASGTGGSRGPA